MKCARIWIVTVVMILAASLALAAEEKLFDAMDDASAWKWGKKKPAISVTQETVGNVSAITVKVNEGKNFAIALRTFAPDKSWDSFDGMVLRVRGDGSRNFGCIRMQCGGWTKGYVANFPLADTNWHDVKMAWSDFVPATHSVPALGSATGYKPSNVNLFALGKSWNFNTSHKSPAITFSVDSIKLVKGIKGSRKRVTLAKLPRVSLVVAKMKAGKPVTLLALGDSITWGTSAGGNANAYPKLVADRLRAHFKNSKITVLSAAIGGSTTAKGRQWMMRDVVDKQVDLVTAMFGYNEKCGKPEDRAKRTAEFTANLAIYVEEVAGLMDSPPAAVFLATVPGRQTHWETLDCYAEGIRKLKTKHRNITVADVGAHMKALGKEKYRRFMADEAHPNAEGHKQIAKVVFEAIIGAGSDPNDQDTQSRKR